MLSKYKQTNKRLNVVKTFFPDLQETLFRRQNITLFTRPLNVSLRIG